MKYLHTISVWLGRFLSFSPCFFSATLLSCSSSQFSFVSFSLNEFLGKTGLPFSVLRSRLSTYKFRFAVFCCIDRSWLYLHLFPFWHKPCLKNTHKRDFGSTSKWNLGMKIDERLPLSTLGKAWTGLNNLKIILLQKVSSPILVKIC